MAANIVSNAFRGTYNMYLKMLGSSIWSVKERTNGMLHPMVYKRIYESVRPLPDLDIVEMGAGGGASSIAIALAMKESGKKSKLIVVEKCSGGSRAKFGGYDDNLTLLKRNFEHFGVADIIRLWPHELTLDNADELMSLIGTDEIAAFMHDADGRLDRDFRLFWPRLRTGGLIIVDDYENKANFKQKTEQNPQGGIKHLLTFHLLNQMSQWGLYRQRRRLGNTVFGYKPDTGSFDRFDQQVCDGIIERIQQERDAHLNRSREVSYVES